MSRERVLRLGGRAVLLTTCKRELNEAVAAEDGWRRVARHHMMIGAMRACAHVLVKCAPTEMTTESPA